MKKLLIVDGSNLLFQMYYGMPARIVNSQGQAIQGILGFVGALLKIIRMTDPTHAAVLFDGECQSIRKGLDQAYKANRPQLPQEDNPYTQLPDIYKALDMMGICHRETADCEADDWIAGYAKQYGSNMYIVIASFDSDFFQLITDRVTVLRYRGKQSISCDRAYIQEKLGIRPEQYADYKVLTGDTADNIKGAEKIGPKTAAALMTQFGSLETLLKNPDKIRQPSVRLSVEKNAPRLRLNCLLIHLDGNGELPFSMEELAYQDPGLSTMQILHAIGVQ